MAVSAIGLQRTVGERDFSARARRLLNFFHGELGALIGRSLVSAAEPAPAGLAPRLRQTLACLLEGDSEKQVASRLGVSPATTHQYVTALYRHFASRAAPSSWPMSSAASDAGNGDCTRRPACSTLPDIFGSAVSRSVNGTPIRPGTFSAPSARRR